MVAVANETIIPVQIHLAKCICLLRILHIKINVPNSKLNLPNTQGGFLVKMIAFKFANIFDEFKN